jgi:hypothetical protein
VVLLAATGYGARLTDTVNASELLINLVRIVVPKLLLGIDQKVCGRLSRSNLETRRRWAVGE